jgi:hypothetical protein
MSLKVCALCIFCLLIVLAFFLLAPGPENVHKVHQVESGQRYLRRRQKNRDREHARTRERQRKAAEGTLGWQDASD